MDDRGDPIEHPTVEPAEPLLPAALLEALARHGNTRSFRAQSVLISEGDASDALFIVLRGRLRTYASSADGRDVVLAEHGPGDYVGELALDGGARSASVKTVEASSCCVVSGPELRNFLAEQPDFALHLLRKLSRMARRLTEQVKSFALQDVYGRMARVLTELSDVAGSERIVRDKLTQQDIADRVGASRDMIGKLLKDLVAGGYLQVEDRTITFLKKLPPGW